MTDEKKIWIAAGVILLILSFFAWHSIYMLPKRQPPIKAPLLSSQVQTPAEFATLGIPTKGGSPAVLIPTAEEIELSIADQDQKRKTMEKLIETRNAKAGKVMAAVEAESSLSDSQETLSEKDTPKLSLEERDERNKEIRDGIKAHRYFPR